MPPLLGAARLICAKSSFSPLRSALNGLYVEMFVTSRSKERPVLPSYPTLAYMSEAGRDALKPPRLECMTVTPAPKFSRVCVRSIFAHGGSGGGDGGGGTGGGEGGGEGGGGE
eukprot:5403139-Prymnesium_polylepis.1